MNFTRTTLRSIAGRRRSVSGSAHVRRFAMPIPQVGQKAPSFTLPSQEGTNVSLHQYRGKWVVLYFYPKDMTSGCTIEAHNFQTDMGKFDAANAVVLGVSVQSVKSHQEFCAKDGSALQAAGRHRQESCCRVWFAEQDGHAWPIAIHS